MPWPWWENRPPINAVNRQLPVRAKPVMFRKHLPAIGLDKKIEQ